MKTTLIIVGVIIIILSISYYRGLFPFKAGRANQECLRRADSTLKMTAREDRERAAQESYYYCLLDKGLNPYKYKWKGKNMGDNMMKMIELRREFLDAPQLPQAAIILGQEITLKIGQDGVVSNSIIITPIRDLTTPKGGIRLMILEDNIITIHYFEDDDQTPLILDRYTVELKGRKPGQGTFIVRHRAPLTVGQNVYIVGTASNTKISAGLETSAETVFITNLDSWPKESIGKRIKVFGTLQFQKNSSSDPYSQNMSGDYWYIEDAIWSIVK